VKPKEKGQLARQRLLVSCCPARDVSCSSSSAVRGTIGDQLTKWNGVTTPKFHGLDNYATAMATGFLELVQNNLSLILAMVVIPTILGLLLAGLLFSYIAPRFGVRAANFFRAGFYLPQVMPVAIAGVVWGWILAPDGALNALLQAIGLACSPTTGWEDAGPRSSRSWHDDLVPGGFPLVIFFTALQRTDPALA